MDRVYLLGVPVDPVTPDGALERLRTLLNDGGKHHVMTPNNEMLVEAAYDLKFHALLNRTALNLPDSTGLLFMAKFTKQFLPARVTGIDTVTAFCQSLSAEHRVFLLGAGEGVAAQAADALKAMNPQLRIAGTYAGSPELEYAANIVQFINDSGADVLLVAYGAPKQDQWIDAHLKELSSVKLAMGVGGTFDFLAGEVIRAPRFLRDHGLEWLWRLLMEPSRLGRILTAVGWFPYLVARYGKESPHT